MTLMKSKRPIRKATTVGHAGVVVPAIITAALTLGWLPSGCKPELGAPPSLIMNAQMLDLHATPAEAKPGTDVMLEALLVDPTGTLTAPVAWTTCGTPKPPAESNAVSRACVDQPDDGSAQPGSTTVRIPSDACSLFGPLTPPAQAGQPPVRPRDPDPTGGFYQPVRATARGLTGADSDLLGFALVRISCALANAPAEIAQQFNDPTTGYRPNVAPTFAAVNVIDATGVESPAIAADASSPSPPPPNIRSGQSMTIRAAWPPEAAEMFRLFDIKTRNLIDAREALHVSWFASAGELQHDRTGRSSDDLESSTENKWTCPLVTEPTTVHFWIVLRDSRGGTAWAGFDVTVAP